MESADVAQNNLAMLLPNRTTLSVLPNLPSLCKMETRPCLSVGLGGVRSDNTHAESKNCFQSTGQSLDMQVFWSRGRTHHCTWACQRDSALSMGRGFPFINLFLQHTLTRSQCWPWFLEKTERMMQHLLSRNTRAAGVVGDTTKGPLILFFPWCVVTPFRWFSHS